MSANAWQLRRAKAPLTKLIDWIGELAAHARGEEPPPRLNRAARARQRRLATIARRKAHR